MCKDCDPKPQARHFGRRQVLALAAAALASGPAKADDCAPFTADLQAATSPDQALRYLMDGNARFSTGKSLRCNLLAQAAATAEKQTPFACVLACIDSRESPELVFDQQIGDIFVARVAGNVPTAEIIGSFEYAAVVAGARAILVVGHNHCGAVKGAIDKAVVGENLTTLLNEMEPAVLATPLHGDRASSNHHFVEEVAATNVRFGVAALTEKSPVLKALVDEGKLKIAGALYDIANGHVTLLT